MKNDNELRRKVAEEWSALNGVEITPEIILRQGIGFTGTEINKWEVKIFGT